MKYFWYCQLWFYQIDRCRWLLLEINVGKWNGLWLTHTSSRGIGGTTIGSKRLSGPRRTLILSSLVWFSRGPWILRSCFPRTTVVSRVSLPAGTQVDTNIGPISTKKKLYWTLFKNSYTNTQTKSSPFWFSTAMIWYPCWADINQKTKFRIKSDLI